MPSPFETRNNLASILVNVDATTRDKAVPIKELIETGIASRGYLYSVTQNVPGFESYFDGMGTKVVWYDYGKFKQYCRMGEYYPRSIPKELMGDSEEVIEQVARKLPPTVVGTVALPAEHNGSGTKPKLLAVEWVELRHNKSVNNIENFKEGLRKDTEELISAIEAVDTAHVVRLSGTLLNRLAALYWISKGGDME